MSSIRFTDPFTGRAIDFEYMSPPINRFVSGESGASSPVSPTDSTPDSTPETPETPPGGYDLLINGDTVVSPDGTYDFGDVPVFTSDDRPVVFRNNTASPVDVYDVTLFDISGPVAGVSTGSVFTPRPQTVLAGGTLLLCTLNAFSFSAGEFLGTFSPDANGSGDPLFSVTIRCNFV